MPRKLLAQLADTGSKPTSEALTALSGLDARALHDFQLVWANTKVARRCEILLALQPLLEANATLDFSAVATAALADPDGDVRTAAVPLLFDDVNPKPVTLLLDLLQSDPHAPCRAAAARELVEYAALGATEDLPKHMMARIEAGVLRAHRTDADPNVKRTTLEALGYCLLPEVNEALLAASKTSDAKLLASACLAMGHTCDSARWSKLVAGRLDHAVDFVRTAAVHACGELQLQSAVPQILELAMDGEPDTVSQAVWALGEIGGTDARAALYQLQGLAEKDAELSEEIEEAIATLELLSGEIDFDLMDGTDDDDPDVEDSPRRKAA